MSIALDGKTYRTALDLSGRIVVLVRTGSQWRIVGETRKAAILAGFYSPCVGNGTATIA